MILLTYFFSLMSPYPHIFLFSFSSESGSPSFLWAVLFVFRYQKYWLFDQSIVDWCKLCDDGFVIGRCR